MKKIILFIIFFFALLCNQTLQAQCTWTTVGAAVSPTDAAYTSIAIDGSGTPYVVYRDNGNSNKATVMKFNGSAWVTVGTAGFSVGQVYSTFIAIDGSGTPYVVYQDGGNSYKATVMKFNGSAWVTVGSAGFSAGAADFTSIAIDGSGTPYVVYRDNANSYYATCMKFNGTAWVNVGSAGFSAGQTYYTSIAIDGSGTPYVVYQDFANSYYATCMKFNGSAWVNVGAAAFSAGNVQYTNIAIDGSGTPYVVCKDNGNKATAMKFNGSVWVNVGAAGFSTSGIDYPSIAIDGSGTPYVVYQDGGNSYKATVMKFNGSAWVTVGSAGFSTGQATYPSIAINGGGTPYVVYADYGNSDKATVMKLAAPVVSVTSTSTLICSGKSATLTPSGAGTGGTYTITGGTFTVSPNVTTSYSVTGTNSAGCVGINTAVITVSVNTTPTVAITGTTICSGKIGTLTPSGASSYSVNNVATGTFTFNPVNTTTYAVTGASVGCVSNSVLLTVNVNTTPTVAITGTTICSGKIGTLSPSGASSYSVNNVATGTFTFNPVNTTTYAVTGTSVGCVSNSVLLTVNVNTTPTVAITGTTICSGKIATLTPSGASSYSVNNVATSNFTFSPANTTTYAVTGASVGCVSNSVLLTVNVNTTPTVAITGTTICSGKIGTLTPSGASSYSVNNVATSNFTFNPVNTTTYAVTGASVGCVSNSVLLTVNVNTTPTVAITGTTICSGKIGTLTPSGASSYSVNNVATSNFTFSPANTTTYAVTGASVGCVSNSVLLTVNVNTTPTVAITGTTICSGKIGTLTPSGASSYSVNNVATSNFTFNPVNTTTYAVTGASVGCVSNSVLLTVNVNTTPTVAITGTTICSGKIATLTPSGASSYSVNNVATSTFTFNPVNTTTYAITGASVGCVSNSVLLTVNVNTTPTVAITGTTICSGNIATLTPSGASSYSVNNVATGTFTFNPVNTTTYAVTGTSVGCVSNSVLLTVNVNTTPTVAITGTTICSGNSVVLVPSGANTYTISGGTFTVNPSTTTSYSVTGTSTDGCVSNNTAVSTVTVNATSTLAVNSGSICSGDSFTIIPTGADSYSVTGNNFTVTPIAGNYSYSVTGTSSVGCAASNTAVSTLVVNSGSICSGSSLTIVPTLYGMTPYGGSEGVGTIFSISTGSTALNSSFSFSSSTNTGETPYGSLMAASNGKLYGLTSEGGANWSGTLFEYDLVNNTPVTKWDFDDDIDGSYPEGSLIQATNGKLYGITNDGGANWSGTFFEYDINSGTLTVKQDFDYSYTGAYPYGSLMQAANGKLYGMTSEGGANGSGTLFEYDIFTNIFSVKHDFVNSTGSSPQGSLIQASNGLLYGMTSEGGNDGGVSGFSSFALGGGGSSDGTLFEYNPTTNSLTVKHTFDSSSEGGHPYGSLTQLNNGKLYGVTNDGAANNGGSLFEYNPATDNFIVKKNFDNNSSPYGTLLHTGSGKLYGMTRYGGSGNGSVFEYDLTTSAFTTKLDFEGANGAYPYGDLIQVNTPTAGCNMWLDFSSTGACMGPVGSITVTAIDGLGPYTYSWSPVAGSNSVISGLSAGIYTVNVSDVNSCSATGTVEIISPAMFTVGLSGGVKGAYMDICFGDSTMLATAESQSNLAVFYTWIPGNITIQNTYVSPTVMTIYTVTGSDAYGCLSLNTATFQVDINSLPTVVASVSSTVPLCPGTPIELMVSGADTYVWNPGNFYGDVVTVPAPDVYTVTGTDWKNCSNTATIAISMLPSPTVIVAPMATVVPSGSVSVWIGYGQSPYSSWAPWTFTFNDPLPPGAQIIGASLSYDGTGTQNTPPIFSINNTFISDIVQPILAYSWQSFTLDYAGAMPDYVYGGVNAFNFVYPYWSGDYAEINNANLILYYGVAAPPICVGQQAILSATVNGAVSYSWSGGIVDNVPFTPTSTPSHITNINGIDLFANNGSIYTVTAVAANGCVTEVQELIAVSSLPVLSFTGNPIICLGSSATIEVSGADTYSWNTGSTNNSINITPSVSTLYSVTGTNTLTGCVNTASYTTVVNSIQTANIINTFAGSSSTGAYGGDNALATSALLDEPAGLATDASGNVYIADYNNHRVRKVSPNGIITTIAGTGTAGYSGDGSSAIAAELNHPSDIAVDAAGNIYIADANNHCIRKVDNNGIISTFAGDGTFGFSGDGGLATSAQLYNPTGVAVDALGNLYIADQYNHCIRMVDNSGYISTIAGTGASGGFSGDGGLATSAQLNQPVSVTLDGLGNLYITDSQNNRVRKVDNGGNISTAAGNGTVGYGSNDVPATSTNIYGPQDITIDNAGNFYFSEYGATRIRKVNTNGIITTIAGTGVFGYSGDGGEATSAQLNHPYGITIDTYGNMYIADYDNHRIRSMRYVEIEASPVSLCSGNTSTLTVSGATSYTWNTAQISTSIAVQPPVTTNYSLITNACATASIDISVGSSPTLSIFGSNAMCFGATITQSVSGADTYTWSTGYIGNSISISPTVSTIYNVVATNTASGCSDSTSVPVTVSSAPVFSITNSSQQLCAGQNATLSVNTAPTGYALDFDGTNDYISIPYSAAINPSVFTIETWIKVNAITLDFQSVVTSRYWDGFSNVFYGYALYVNPLGQWDVLFGNGPGGNWQGSVGGGMVQTGVWTHVAMTHDGASMAIYINGILMGSTSVPFAPNMSQEMRIGAGSTEYPTANMFFGGQMDEFRIWNYAMTNAQIQDEMNRCLSGTESGLAAYYTMTNGSGSILTDNSGKGHNGTLQNMNTATAWVPGIQTCSFTSYNWNPGGLNSATISVSPTLTTTYTLNTTSASGCVSTKTTVISVTPLQTANIINTYAGTVGAGYSGDGGAATSAQLQYPFGISTDAFGNVYIADHNNHCIRKVDAVTGIINTIAGIGTPWYSGDGGLATSAELNYPFDVVVDATGNVYVADADNHRIRKIDAGTGIINTIAGTGAAGFSGDGSAASLAQLSYPQGIAIDAAGNIYIADASNHRIRKIDASTGNINTIAGIGSSAYSGDGGPATSAELNSPFDVTLDAFGNIYIADLGNNCIRKITMPGGIISTIAGTTIAGYSGDNGQATLAQLNNPTSVALDPSGNVYIVDNNNHRLRKINAYTGIISTIAGSGSNGFGGDNWQATSANLSNPYGVAIDAIGKVYISDRNNHRIRSFYPLEIVATATTLCSSNNITLTANSSAQYYIWNTGETSFDIVKQPTVTTTYSVLSGCTSNSLNINVGITPTLSIAGNSLICAGGTTSLTASGADAYLWSNASGSLAATANIVPSSSVSAAYSVIGTNTLAGCESTANTFVKVDYAPIVNITPDAQLLCSGQSTSLTSVTRGRALDFDGINDNVTIPRTGNLNWSTDSVFTIETWFRFKDPSSQLWVKSSEYTPFYFGFGWYYGSAPYFGINNGGGWCGSLNNFGITVTPDFNWHHAAVVYDGPNSKLVSVYVDGLLSYSYNYACTTSVSSGGNIYLQYNDLDGSFQRGQVDELRIWNLARTQAEIQADMNACLTGNEAGLAVYFNMDQSDASTTTLLDNTGGTHTGTLNGMSSNNWVTGIPSCDIASYTWNTGATTPSISITPSITTSYTLTVNTSAGCTNTTTAQVVVNSIQTANIINTFAGNGSAGFGGDNGAANLAQLSDTKGMAIDAAGNVFVTDYGNHVVRKINPNGIITTIAGIPGLSGTNGDGGLATSAYLYSPAGVAVDAAGNVYISETGSSRVRKVSPGGIITTFAGIALSSGFSGDGGLATSAQLDYPVGLAVDAAGNLYIADNYRVRKVSPSGTITTIAGTGTYPYNGDNIAATSANFSVRDIAVDLAGNVYIADAGNNLIRKVDASTGFISSVAGSTTTGIGYSGDGGAATAAYLNQPNGVDVDAAGNIYIADFGNSVIRKISAATGIINTIAGDGTGSPGYSGDGGLAASAQLGQSRDIAVDALGRVFISDESNNRIRYLYNIDMTATPSVMCAGSNTVFVRAISPATTYTWNTGHSSDYIAVIPVSSETLTVTGGCATNTVALAVNPLPTLSVIGNSVACFGASLTYSVTGADTYSWSTGNIGSTITLTPSVSTTYSVIGTTTAAACSASEAISITVSPSPTISIAGNQMICEGNSASLTANGADTYSWSSGDLTNSVNLAPIVNTTYTITGTNTLAGCAQTKTFAITINSLQIANIINTFAGNGTAGYSGDGGAANLAQLSVPFGAAVDAVGNVYVAEYGNSVVRKINTNGIITTIAGTGVAGFNGDGIPATSAQLNHPTGVTVDPFDNVYITDQYNNSIRKVDVNGMMSTVVGGLYAPVQSALDAAGNIYVADSGNDRIVKVTPSGSLTVVAGGNGAGYSGDGGLATSAQLSLPTDVAIDAAGNIYIADANNRRIRKVTVSTGMISTIAGNGVAGYNGDNIAATSAQLNSPTGVAVDASGNIYITDANNYRIRKVNTNGIISTIAGTGTSGYSGDGGAAMSAQINGVADIVTDALGKIYFTEQSNHLIRTLYNVDIATTPSAVCFGNTATLTASGPATSYLWNTAQTFSSVAVQPSVASTYSVLAGCASASVSVMVNPTPTAPVSSTSNSLCVGQNATLAVNTIPAGYALDFDGVDDYVSVPYNPALNTTNFTVEFWAKVNAVTGNYQGLVTSRETSNKGFVIYVNPAGNWQLTLGDGSVWVGILGPPVQLNQWTHITGTYDGAFMTLYVNGEATGAPTFIVYTPNSNQPMYIGSGEENDLASFYFGGEIDEVRLWNTALNTSQIQEEMGRCLAGNESNLAAYYTMTDGTGSPTLSDNSSNGHTGTLTNMTPASDWVSGMQTCNLNSYSWSSGGSTSSVNISPASTTSYVVTYTNMVGCSGTSSKNMVVNSQPTVVVSGTTQICATSGGTGLTASGADTYSWSSGSTSSLAAVNPTVNSTYSVVGTNTTTGCQNTATKSLIVNPRPVISVNSGSICSGNVFSISLSGANTYTSASNFTVTGTSVTVAPTTSKNYSVSGTSSLGCVSNAAGLGIAQVTVNITPTVSVNSGSICTGNSFTIIPAGANVYAISGGTDIVSPAPGISTYSVTGTSTAGCVSNNTVVSSVTVNIRPAISVNSGSICSGYVFTMTPSGAFTYTYSSGTNTVNPLVDATYSVTGTNSLGCVSSSAAITNVIVHATPTLNVNSGAICFGNNFIIAPNGASTYTVTGNNFTVSPGSQTDYSVTGTSSVGCAASNTAISTVTVNSLPVLAIAGSNTVCFASVVSQTVSGTDTYSWSSGQSADIVSLTPSLSTTYSVTGTNSLTGCKSTSIQAITVYTLPIISVNSGSICNGNSFIMNPNGANTYTYSSGSNIVSPLTNTSYAVTGTDILGCVSASAAVANVTVIALPVVSVSDGTVCAGNVYTIIPNGAATYTYSNGSSTVIPSGNASYSITGTSSVGCISSNTAVASVTVISLPTLSLTGNSVVCLNDSLNQTVSGADSYLWVNTGETAATVTLTPLPGTTYSVIGTNVLTGCSNQITKLITVYPLPTISINSSTVACTGTPLILSGSGADTYTWIPGNLTGTTVSYSPINTATYIATGTSSDGCVGVNTPSIVIPVYPSPQITITPTGTSNLYIGSGQTGVSSWSPWTFNFSDPLPAGSYITGIKMTYDGVDQGWGGTGQPTSMYVAGQYIGGNVLTHTQQNGLTFNYTGPISNYVYGGNNAFQMYFAGWSGWQAKIFNANLVIYYGTSATTVCAGQQITLSASESTGSVTLNWSGGHANNVPFAAPFASQVYTVSGTNSFGCTSLLTESVIVKPIPTVAVNSGAICEGQTYTIHASGATSYTWSGGANTTSISVSPIVSTSYTVSGTNTLNCTASVVANVTVNITPTVSIAGSNTVCSGLFVTQTASGASTYTWNTGAITSSISDNPLVYTTYSVTGTSSLGCISGNTAVSNVSVLITPTVSVNSGAICIGDLFTLAPSGADSYSISGGTTIVSPSSTNSYSVTGTSSVGCLSFNTAVSTVTVNPLPVLSVSGNTEVCYASAVSQTVSGTDTYSWSGGQNTDIVSLAPTVNTTYTVTGTNTLTGCFNQTTKSITVNPQPTISVNSGTVCSGLTFTMNPSGAISYTFSNGSNLVSPPSNSNFSVSGTNVYGCVSASPAVSEVTVLITPTISVNSGTVCPGKTFTMFPSGAFTYTFSNGSPTVNVSSNSTYSVIGTSSLGCTAANYTLASVTVVPGPALSISGGSLVCEGSSISQTVTGASSYSWSTGSTNTMITVSPASNTTYSVTAINPITGCSGSLSKQIIVGIIPVISVNSGNMCEGGIFTMMPSGASTYTYSSGSNTVSPSANTSYYVTGTSAEGCLATNTAIANVIISPLPVIAVNNGLICSGHIFTIVPSGASSYTFSNGTNTVSPLSTTSYSVFGTDILGCTSSVPGVATVSVNTSPVISASNGSVCAGSIYTIVPSGADTYTFSSITNAVSPTSDTSYSITGTSEDGCVSSNTAIVTVSVMALPVISVNSGSVCEGDVFTMTPTGADLYSYSTFFNTPTIVPVSNTSYSVTGTSSVGCVASNTAVANVTVMPVPTISVSGGLICTNSVFTITPSGAATYSYSSGSNTVTPSVNSSYTVTGVSAAGCAASNTVVALVLVKPAPQIAVFGSNDVICIGNSSTLTAIGSATGYTWSSNTATSPVTGSVAIITPSVTDTYTVMGIAANGCTNIATQDVTINPLPNITVTSGTVCPTDVFVLQPNGAVTYTYSGGSATVAPSGTVVYSVTGTDANGCISLPATATISIANNVTVSASGNTLVCSGSPASLTASGATNYLWSTGEFSSDIVPTPTANTTYTVIGAVGLCADTAVIAVSVNALPNITVSSTSTLICTQESATLSVTGAANSYTYTWSENNIEGDILVISPPTTTSYTVTALDANGCTNSAIITQSVNVCPGIVNWNWDEMLNIYPNPNMGEFFIETDREISVSVLNVLGQVIKQEKLQPGKNPINLNTEAKGIYFVEIKYNHKVKTVKVVKQG